MAFIKRKLANRPDLIQEMTPVAPPYSARPIIVDTDYSIYDALLRDDVTLDTDPILKIKPNGIEDLGRWARDALAIDANRGTQLGAADARSLEL